jgi:hypothetical protein
MIDYTDIVLEKMATQMQQFNDVLRKQTRAYSERMEKELHGAWRAGYDYAHVYNHLHIADPTRMDPYTVRQYVLPSNTQAPPKTTPDMDYSYTYDLTEVPDHVIRAAIKGELEKYERINTDR